MNKPLHVSDVLQDFRVGIRLARFLPKQNPKEYRVLKISNLGKETNSLDLWATKGSVLLLENSQVIKRGNQPTLKRHELKPNDVLVPLQFGNFWAACVPTPISKWSQSEGIETPCLAYGGLIVLSPNPSKISGEYLTMWLRSKAAVRQVDQIRKVEGKKQGATGQRFFVITLQGLIGLSINPPSLAEQAVLVQKYQETINESKWMGLDPSD